MDLVSLAKLRDHSAFGMLGTWLLHDRFMEIGVERLFQGGDRLDPVLGQDAEQLFLYHVQPGGDSLVRRCAKGFDGALQVIDAAQHVLRQATDGVGSNLVGLLLGALLIIGEIRLDTQDLVLQLVAFLL